MGAPRKGEAAAGAAAGASKPAAWGARRARVGTAGAERRKGGAGTAAAALADGSRRTAAALAAAPARTPWPPRSPGVAGPCRVSVEEVGRARRAGDGGGGDRRRGEEVRESPQADAEPGSFWTRHEGRWTFD